MSRCTIKLLANERSRHPRPVILLLLGILLAIVRGQTYPSVGTTDLPWLQNGFGNFSMYITAASADGFAICHGTNAWSYRASQFIGYQWTSLVLGNSCIQIATVGSRYVFFLDDGGSISFDIYEYKRSNMTHLPSSLSNGPGVVWGGIGTRTAGGLLFPEPHLLVSRLEADGSKMTFYRADLFNLQWIPFPLPSPLHNNNSSSFPFATFSPIERYGTVVVLLPAAGVSLPAPVLDMETMQWLRPLPFPSSLTSLTTGTIHATSANAQQHSTSNKYQLIVYSSAQNLFATYTWQNSVANYTAGTATGIWSEIRGSAVQTDTDRTAGYVSSVPAGTLDYLVYSDGTLYDFAAKRFSAPGSLFDLVSYNRSRPLQLISSGLNEIYGITDTDLMVIKTYCSSNTVQQCFASTQPTVPGTTSAYRPSSPSPPTNECDGECEITGKDLLRAFGILLAICAGIALVATIVCGGVLLTLAYFLKWRKERRAHEDPQLKADVEMGSLKTPNEDA